MNSRVPVELTTVGKLSTLPFKSRKLDSVQASDEARDSYGAWRERGMLNETIEMHFVTCLFVLGPKAHDQGPLAYYSAVEQWWRENVGTAGSAWYASWFIKWCAVKQMEKDNGAL